MAFAEWMATPLGRVLRVAAGTLLIYVGLAVVHGIGGIVLAAVGVVPIVAGLLNLCPIGPLIGAPMKGASTRPSAPGT